MVTLDFDPKAEVFQVNVHGTFSIGEMVEFLTFLENSLYAASVRRLDVPETVTFPPIRYLPTKVPGLFVAVMGQIWAFLPRELVQASMASGSHALQYDAENRGISWPSIERELNEIFPSGEF